MNTPTHILVAATVLTKPGARSRNAAALVGAILPDLSIFVLYFWERIVQGTASMQIWRVIYWQEPWQTLGAISNSFPLWIAVVALGVALRSWVLVGLGIAAVLHVALDFPVHNDDAHVHFWPLTDWRFRSPLSYWDPAHFGTVVGPLEAVVGAILAVVLWRRFQNVWVRAVLAVAIATYLMVPAYFVWSLSAAA